MNEPNIIILAGGISSRMKKSAQSAKEIELSLVEDAAAKSKSMIGYDFDGLQFPGERIFQFAILRTDNDGFLESILEKPSKEELEELKGRVGVSMNIFRFVYEDILPFLQVVPLHPARKEKELPEAVRLMAAKQPHSMKTYRRAEYVPDLTTVSDIPAVQQYLQKHFSAKKF